MPSQLASQRIVQGASAELPVTFVDQDGDERAPGPVSVHVTRSDGTDVIAAGTAITPDGAPLIPLAPADTAQLDILTAVCTEENGAVVTLVIEVVGGRYFTLLRARSADKVLQALAKYPDEEVKIARNQVERELERITGRSFVPRFTVDEVDRCAGRVNLTEVDIRSIRWVKANGIAYSSNFYELRNNHLVFGSSLGLTPEQSANGPYLGDGPKISIGYEYGWNTPPDDLVEQMLVRLRSKVVENKNGIPSRATTMSDGNGATFGLATAGQRGALTGYPDVDFVYQSYMRPDWKNSFVGSMRIV